MSGQNLASEYRTFATLPHAPLGGWRKFVIALLGLVIPRANPDLESRFGEVTTWWLEIERGQVVREIGFRSDGTAVVAAPFRDNLGIFTDLDGPPRGTTAGPDGARFNAVFEEVVGRLELEK